MDWRKHFLCCCVVAATCHPIAAQDASQATLTVIGDVASPGKFALRTPITIRSAVAGASPLAEAVNVTVLRHGQPRSQWTKLIRLSARDSGENAANGDVLVVEALSQLQQPAPRNAAVRTTTGTTVIAIEDSGVVVGDVLQGLGIDSSVNSRVRISARMRGQRSLQQAGTSTIVQHGDVLTVDAPLGFIQASAGAAESAYSEWNSQATNVRYPEVPPIPTLGAAPLIVSPGEAGLVPQVPDIASWPSQEMHTHSLVARPETDSEVPETSVTKTPQRGDMEESLSEDTSDVVISLEQQLGVSPVPRELSTLRPAKSRETQTASKTRVLPSAVQPTVAASGRSYGTDLIVISVLLLGGVWMFIRSYRASAMSVSRTGSAGEAAGGRDGHVAVTANVLPAAAQTEGALLQSSERTASGGAVSARGRGNVVSESYVASASTAPSSGSFYRVDAGRVPESATEYAKVYGTPRPAALTADTSGRQAPQRSRLDNLLRNAVPIDHVTPQLPADLNLYGRAQNPPQYRADSEHTTINAPHFERSRTRVQGNVAENRLSRIVQAEAVAAKASGVSTAPVTSRHDGNGT